MTVAMAVIASIEGLTAQADTEISSLITDNT